MTAPLRGSHGLSGRRARRTKSSRPEGPKAGPKGRKLEVGARRAPRLLVHKYFLIDININRSTSSLHFSCGVLSCRWSEQGRGLLSQAWLCSSGSSPPANISLTYLFTKHVLGQTVTFMLIYLDVFRYIHLYLYLYLFRNIHVFRYI